MPRILTRIIVMAPPRQFAIIFAPETLDHIAAIERKYQSFIERTIDEQLSFTPERETRNRKPFERPTAFGATWELRFGANNRFRIFYEVDSTERTVRILAVGVKQRNKLSIGGKEIEI